VTAGQLVDMSRYAMFVAQWEQARIGVEFVAARRAIGVEGPNWRAERTDGGTINVVLYDLGETIMGMRL